MATTLWTLAGLAFLAAMRKAWKEATEADRLEALRGGKR